MILDHASDTMQRGEEFNVKCLTCKDKDKVGLGCGKTLLRDHSACSSECSKYYRSHHFVHPSLSQGFICQPYNSS